MDDCSFQCLHDNLLLCMLYIQLVFYMFRGWWRTKRNETFLESNSSLLYSYVILLIYRFREIVIIENKLKNYSLCQNLGQRLKLRDGDIKKLLFRFHYDEYYENKYSHKIRSTQYCFCNNKNTPRPPLNIRILFCANAKNDAWEKSV